MGEKPHILILSGFLGSGKTTLLVQLIAHLRAKHGENYRIAIIENEIGAASVGSSIIQDAGYSVTEMLSGCVCCTLIGQLVPAINKLVEELEPQLIILEATGVAAPGSIAENISKYSGHDVRIVTHVDASRWERIKMALAMLLESQLEPADIICINKVDLVEEPIIDDVERDIRLMNAYAIVVHASATGTIAAADLDLLAGE